MQTRFHYFVRLLVAVAGRELLPEEQPLLERRLDQLWDQLHQLLKSRFALSDVLAVTLLEELAASILQRNCCRRAVWRSIPLEVALGPHL